MSEATITISQDLAFAVLDVLRLSPIYALMGSEFEDELPEDFKPHKWQGCEKEHAEEAVAAYREMLSVMDGQIAAPDEGQQPS